MRSLAVVLMCLVSQSVFGQTISSEYFRNGIEVIEHVPDLNSDVSLFLIPLEGGADVFSSLSMYNFSSVRYLRRGYDYKYMSNYVNGIDLLDAIGSGPNFSLIGQLRKARPSESYLSGLSSDNSMIGGLCGVAQRSVRARDVAAGNRASINVSDRRYRWAMDVSSSGMTKDEKWSYAMAASRKFGRDGYIDGVFTDNYGLSLSVDRIFNKKHAITFFATAEKSQQGLRSASTQEVFNLTGNNLYNPSWGYYMGDPRSSKVTNALQPFFLMSYDATLGKATKLSVSASYQFGSHCFSSLSWRDAQTPQPDYYRSLPGFFNDGRLSEFVTEQWRAKNSDVIYINWRNLVEANSSSVAEASYLIEDRVEDVSNLQFAAIARSQVNQRVDLHYGLRFRSDTRQNYKELKDLLGAKSMTDKDRFRVDETDYADPFQSDLRNPNRVVCEGDRFGYDYNLYFRQWTAFAAFGYRDNRLRLSCAAELGGTTYSRQGNYDKESSSNINSFGNSDKQRFDHYKVKAGVGYSFSPRQNIDATLMYAQDVPQMDNVFVSPLFSNNTIHRVDPIRIAASEFNYNLTLDPVKLKFSIYYTKISGESEVYNYYDDINRLQSHLVLSQIDKSHYGAEIGADVSIAKGLTLRVAASVGSFTYCSDPRADILNASDLSANLSDSRAYLKNYRLGSVPQRVASAELKYSGSYGWLVTLSVNHMASRFVQMNPIRRMDRAMQASVAPEYFNDLVAQEELPAAMTLNLFILKSFKIGRSDFFVIASVNNLLNNRNIIYSGYEQMRFSKINKGYESSYLPFASKYLYSYGRSYFCSINYKF